MSRAFDYPEGWDKMMADFTVKHTVEHQVRPVIARYRHPNQRGAFVKFTDADILKHCFPEWHGWFIYDVLTEMHSMGHHEHGWTGSGAHHYDRDGYCDNPNRGY